MNNEIIINPKTQFVEDVKRWALIDSQLKIVNEKIIYLIWYLFRETGNSHEGKISK
jgi:hypothetical protein